MEGRVTQVLHHLLLPATAAPHSSCLERLLTHIETDPEIIQYVSVKEWIIHCATEWNGALNEINKSIKSFILRLISFATVKENLYNELSEKDVYKKIFATCNLQQQDPSMKLAVLKILCSMCLHSSGVSYLLESQLWNDVLKQSHNNHTVYISRINLNFMANFLWKLDDLNLDEDCNKVISAIVLPLIEHRWKDNKIMDEEENFAMDTALTPTLQILTNILIDVEHFGRSTIISRALIKQFNLDTHLWNIFQLCRKSILLGSISKLLMLIRMFKTYVDKMAYNKIAEEDVKEFCLIHCQLMSALLSKHDIESILELSNFCFTHVVKIRDHFKGSLIVRAGDVNYDFTNQIIIMSVLPTVCSLKVREDDFLELYFEKILSLACEKTTILAYALKDMIKEKNDITLAIKAIQSSITLKKYLSKSQAVLIFQSYYYRMQDFVPDNDDASCVVIGVNDWETAFLLSTLLEAVYIFIDTFDIPWQDTVEVLCVYNFCTRVIKTSNLDSKLVIKAFRLAQLTIKKFLSPNLALLVDSTHGSVIEEIGKTIYEKLHDPHWDIRDSAMELLYIVADVAEIKFPAFQQQIASNGLPELVFTLAMEDSESYVRASAFRCITIMVKINTLWENHLQFLDIPIKMMNILYEESEGIVRKEAANLMTSIYEYHKFNASLLDSIFMAMFHAAAEDLHWEVQLAALQFWKKVISNQLSHQGMIDGIFPSVTFSTENKKIVKLNEAEIQQRLIKILNELALRGCLGALLCCMKDDSEVEVMENALEVIDELLELLNKYKITEIDKASDKSSFLSRPVFDENFLKNEAEIAKIGSYRNTADIRSETNCMTLNTGQNSDSIIESIVNSNDVNLLSHVYANRLKVDTSEDEKPSEMNTKNCVKNLSNMFIEPKTFVSVVKNTNFKSAIEEKRKWNIGVSSDINSLIDDILGSYTPSSEINNMDCY